MATFLLRLLEASGVEVPEVATGRPFLDVRAADVHAGSIAALADLGIVRGTGGGLFRPEATVTRAQTMTFLVGDRKSVVSGRRGVIGEDRCGRSIIKKKNNTTDQIETLKQIL